MSKSKIGKYIRRAGYTYMNHVWTLDKSMTSLSTCHPGIFSWIAILLNLAALTSSGPKLWAMRKKYMSLPKAKRKAMEKTASLMRDRSNWFHSARGRSTLSLRWMSTYDRHQRTNVVVNSISITSVYLKTHFMLTIIRQVSICEESRFPLHMAKQYWSFTQSYRRARYLLELTDLNDVSTVTHVVKR